LDVNPSQCSAATHQDVQVSKQRVNWQQMDNLPSCSKWRKSASPLEIITTRVLR
jgi:hypothetical protein